MAARKRVARHEAAQAHSETAVTAFLRGLDHPLKKEIENVRRIILSVSPQIREAIKWNAPSFRTTEFFATFHLRVKDQVQLIFHKGAKVKDNTTKQKQIADPAGLVKWLATDRCLVTLGAGKDVLAKRGVLQAIVQQWIRHL